MTMLNSFCAASNFKSLLQRTDNPVFAECATAVQRATRERLPGAPWTASQQPSEDTDKSCNRHLSKKQPVSNRLRSALQNIHERLCAEIPGWSLPAEAYFYKRYTMHDIVYCTGASSNRDSTIFFQPSHGTYTMPGIVREIFSVPVMGENRGPLRSETFFAIQAFKECEISDSVNDPFFAHKDFGASLWSTKMADELQVIRTTQRVCHAIYRKWTKDVYVMKPLDKVSNSWSVYLPTMLILACKYFGRDFI